MTAPATRDRKRFSKCPTPNDDVNLPVAWETSPTLTLGSPLTFPERSAASVSLHPLAQAMGRDAARRLLARSRGYSLMQIAMWLLACAVALALMMTYRP